MHCSGDDNAELCACESHDVILSPTNASRALSPFLFSCFSFSVFMFGRVYESRKTNKFRKFGISKSVVLCCLICNCNIETQIKEGCREATSATIIIIRVSLCCALLPLSPFFPPIPLPTHQLLLQDLPYSLYPPTSPLLISPQSPTHPFPLLHRVP